MTLSITRGQSKWAYKIEPDDPCQIWVRVNMHRKRWLPYGPPFDSAQAATDALLKLSRATDARDGAGKP